MIGGIGSFIYLVLIIIRVSLDTKKQVITIRRYCGLWWKKIPFAEFAGVASVRSHFNGVYAGTTLMANHVDRWGNVEQYPLKWALFGGSLDLPGDETERIIAAALAQAQMHPEQK